MAQQRKVLQDDDDNEFDDAFDDMAGSEVEESLARIEESFSESQHAHSVSLHNRHDSDGRQPSNIKSATVATSLSSALKRPGVDTDGKGAAASSSSFRRHMSGPGIDDFRISHQGQVQEGRKLPAGDEEFEDDGVNWGNMDLDKVENDAIELSQRSQGQAPGGVSSSQHKSTLLRSGRPHSASRSAKRSRTNGDNDVHSHLRDEETTKNASITAEILADRRRIEELEQTLAMQQEEILRFKKESQIKTGEASVLRANMNKTVLDFSIILKEKEEAIAKQKALNAEMKKLHEEQLARSETINAFKHTELATTAHWSSITASLARRRGASSQRNLSQSHSQTAAAAVGLTTPTRRNRGANRNLGSGERGSGGSGEVNKRTDTRGEDSPSSRRSLLRQERLESARPKAPAFPGFVNSFARPAQRTPQTEMKPERKRAGPMEDQMQMDDDGAVFQDDFRPPPPPPQAEKRLADQSCGPTSSLDALPQNESEKVAPTGWGNPQYRYLWAIKTYSKRLSFLSSLILSHFSSPCPSADKMLAVTHSSTLYRLLNISFPPQTPAALEEQYVVTTHMLLNILSQGSATDGEERFLYLLHPFEHEEQADLDEQERQKIDGEVFWACQTLMDDGIKDVLSGIASVLCTLMAIASHLEMTQRLYDVFLLMRSICIHQPMMIHALLSCTTPPYLVKEVGIEGPSQEIYSQDLLAASSPQLQMEIHKVIMTNIRREGTVEARLLESKVGPEEKKIAEVAAEELLRAMLQVLHVMAYEVQSNDELSLVCAHKLKRIIDEPGILSALLDENERDSLTIRLTLSVLLKVSQHPSLWRNCMVCKVDKVLEPQRMLHSTISKTDTPLLRILARTLVDCRQKFFPSEAHDIHRGIIILLSQLVVQHSDALVITAESNSVLVALVQCLQMDTELIWTGKDSEEVPATCDEEVMHAVERICLDIRLLAQLYVYPERPASLGKKLQSQECHLLLNGIKHCFSLAVNRIAFAPEPDYFDVAASQLLATVNETAADLLELVFSPEEMEIAWEMLNDEDDEDGEEAETRQQEPHQQQEVDAEEEESQTQMDEDDGVIIVD